MMVSARIRGLTRRHLLKVAAGASAFGLSLMRGRTSRAAVVKTVYVFDHSTEVDASGRGCSACRRHAANKVFASYEVADIRRAHPHCRCAIRAVSVPVADFVTMFGEPMGPVYREEFDVRWTEVMGGLEMPAVWVR